MKITRWRSGRAYLTAIAGGTTGQRMLHSREALLVERQQILKKCHGCMPFLPLSPSGWMPTVTRWPLELTSCCRGAAVGRMLSLEVSWNGTPALAHVRFISTSSEVFSVCSGSFVAFFLGLRVRLKMPMMADLVRATICLGGRSMLSLCRLPLCTIQYIQGRRK